MRNSFEVESNRNTYIYCQTWVPGLTDWMDLSCYYNSNTPNAQHPPQTTFKTNSKISMSLMLDTPVCPDNSVCLINYQIWTDWYICHNQFRHYNLSRHLSQEPPDCPETPFSQIYNCLMPYFQLPITNCLLPIAQ